MVKVTVLVLQHYSTVPGTGTVQVPGTVACTPELKKQILPNGKHRKIEDARCFDFHAGLRGPFIKK